MYKYVITCSYVNKKCYATQQEVLNEIIAKSIFRKRMDAGGFARDKNYTPVNALTPSEVSRCLTGAISIALPRFSMNTDHLIKSKIEYEVEKIIEWNLIEWNDSRKSTQREVIALKLLLL